LKTKSRFAHHIVIFIIFSLLMIITSACGNAASKNPEIILATTTSTNDSGLLDALIPPFEEQTGYQVKIIAVGTGAALEMGDQGNADILLVHAPASEKVLVDNGSAIERRLLMHNDFIIVGPPADLAGIKGEKAASSAFIKIASSNTQFVTRGDNSGTHKKEKSIWKTVGLVPAGDWYIESGQGMGATLRIASEKQAYTLTDRGTYLSLMDTLDLEILVEGDAPLLNIYHAMIVNPEKFPDVNVDGARDLSDYLFESDTQKKIGDFGVDQYGQPLFFPDAGKTEADFGLE